MQIKPCGIVVERKTEQTSRLDGVIYATAILSDEVVDGTLLYSQGTVATLLAENQKLRDKLETDLDDCK